VRGTIPEEREGGRKEGREDGRKDGRAEDEGRKIKEGK
jgi:hypothetical protein